MATHRLLLLKSSNKFYILHSALMDFGFSLLSLPLSLSLSGPQISLRFCYLQFSFDDLFCLSVSLYFIQLV